MLSYQPTERRDENVPESSMCWNSQFIAASGSLFPVARRAFWHRIAGNPMASSCDIAAALNSGIWGSGRLGVSIDDLH